MKNTVCFSSEASTAGLVLGLGRLLKRSASIKSSRGAKVVRKGMFKKWWTVYWFGIKSYWGNGKRGFKFLARLRGYWLERYGRDETGVWS